jgi:hypothetical protein
MQVQLQAFAKRVNIVTFNLDMQLCCVHYKYLRIPANTTIYYNTEMSYTAACFDHYMVIFRKNEIHQIKLQL